MLFYSCTTTSGDCFNHLVDGKLLFTLYSKAPYSDSVKMLNVILVINPRQNLFVCVHGRIIILEYGGIRQQYGNHFIVEDVAIFIQSNSVWEEKEMISWILRYSCRNHNVHSRTHDCNKQAVRIVVLCCGCSPYTNPIYRTITPSSNHQVSKFNYRATTSSFAA